MNDPRPVCWCGHAASHHVPTQCWTTATGEPTWTVLPTNCPCVSYGPVPDEAAWQEIEAELAAEADGDVN